MAIRNRLILGVVWLISLVAVGTGPSAILGPARAESALRR